MGFNLIKGTVHVRGYSPDGDSMKFMVKDPEFGETPDGPKTKRNAKDHVQLRIGGVDSVETYCKGEEGPSAYGHAATIFALKFMGGQNVLWGPTHGRVTSADDGIPAYILARATERYGRPVCFLFPGTTDRANGSNVYLDVRLPKKGLNYALLKSGHAYPMYYKRKTH